MILASQKKPMTDKEQQIYDYVVEQLKSTKICPMQKDIASHFGMSRSLVLHYLNRLSEKGYIMRWGKSPRNIMVPMKAR